MRILTDPATVACDAFISSLTAQTGTQNIFAVVSEEVSVDSVVDADGQRAADAVLLRGAVITPHLLSGCDLAGVCVVGVAHSEEDVRQLERLRLAERVTTPVNRTALLRALGRESSGASWHPTVDSDVNSLVTVTPVADITPAAHRPTAHVPVERVMVHTGVDAVGGSGRIVAVWGPVGSPGVSSTALALAGCAAQAGRSSLVIDANVYGGAQSAMLNLFDEAPGVASACRLAARDELSRDQLVRVSETVTQGQYRMTVLTGIPDSSRWTELAPESIRTVLDRARETWDVTFVDLAFCLEEDEEISSDLFAPRRNGATLSVLAKADVVVGVAGCDSLSLSRYILALPRLREVVGETPVVTCVNRLRQSAAGLAPEASVRETLQRFAGIGDTLCVVNDPDLLDRALVAGKPATWVTQRGRYGLAIRALYERVSEQGAVRLDASA